ncbi:MAG: hypothetical protein K6G92_08895 [Bacteroidaceae bacterium]|nr:hypothetical protein [Bacteroidaceae bacterium]
MLQSRCCSQGATPQLTLRLGSSQSPGAGGTQFIIHNDNEAIYNLAGQRLQKMQRGINIVNGKKVLK